LSGDVDADSLRRDLEAAQLVGRRAVVHSSLRALGHVEGGAAAVAAALAGTLEVLVVPTCSWGEGSPECGAPPGEHWLQNGRSHDDDGPAHVPVPFDPQRTLPARAMGAIPRAVLRLPGVARGGHPLVSFAAVGREPQRYTAGQHGTEPHFPLRQLAADDGLVVLLGVDLSRCTALHVAELEAGVRPFVRWALARDGSRQRVLIGGCSEGFERLWPALRDVFRVAAVGAATARIAPSAELIRRATELFSRDRGAGRCDDRSCARCRDAALGGPIARELAELQ
jgi:aminoglycoside 3-N-acetyltransferase